MLHTENDVFQYAIQHGKNSGSGFAFIMSAHSVGLAVGANIGRGPLRVRLDVQGTPPTPRPLLAVGHRGFPDDGFDLHQHLPGERGSYTHSVSEEKTAQ